MTLAFVLSRVASACVCGSGFGVLPLGEAEGPTAIPPNGVFRLYEGEEGAVEEEDWGVFAPSGERIPTTVERFDEYGGNAVIELRPTEPLADGTWLLRPAAATEGLAYVVSGEPDLSPPPLTRAKFETGGHLRDTSCGEVMWTDLSVEPVFEDPTVIVRIRDVKTGLYWHRAGFAWNDSCGGYPPEAWSGAKEITLVDRAGNESDPARARVCGCSATTAASAWPLVFLAGLLSLCRARYGQAPRA